MAMSPSLCVKSPGCSERYPSTESQSRALASPCCTRSSQHPGSEKLNQLSHSEPGRSQFEDRWEITGISERITFPLGLTATTSKSPDPSERQMIFASSPALSSDIGLGTLATVRSAHALI